MEIILLDCLPWNKLFLLTYTYWEYVITVLFLTTTHFWPQIMNFCFLLIDLYKYLRKV